MYKRRAKLRDFISFYSNFKFIIAAYPFSGIFLNFISYFLNRALIDNSTIAVENLNHFRTDTKIIFEKQQKDYKLMSI